MRTGRMTILAGVLATIFFVSCEKQITEPVDKKEILSESEAQPATELSVLGNYDRQLVVNEAWYAMSGEPYTCGGKQYKNYLVSRWNYMKSDMATQNAMLERFESCGDCAGWTAKNAKKYGFYQSFGRGGQCLFFVNLILYRSGADQRNIHAAWRNIERSSAVVKLAKAGDVIFTLKKWGSAPYNHIAIVVYRSGTTVGLIESNYVDANPTATPPTGSKSGGEIISYRTTTVSKLDGAGFRIYKGVKYY